MEFKVKDGQIIYYRDLGKGFPIVFLHGNNSSGNYFGKQGILYRDYRLIFIDSRNQGRSSPLNRWLPIWRRFCNF